MINNLLSDRTINTSTQRNGVNVCSYKNSKAVKFNGEALAQSKKPSEEIKDELISSTTNPSSLLGVRLKQIQKLPEYAKRGLQGDPDANFYEFLQLGKIPYTLGGLGLVGTFMAGGGHAWKNIAAGCALYYTLAAAADKALKQPIKWFRGVDLDQQAIIKIDTTTGHKIQYHTPYESETFVRWKLLDEKAASGKTNPYEKIKEKLGISFEINETESTVKPIVKKLIILSRSWGSMLFAFSVPMAIGLAQNKEWQEFGKGFNTKMKNILFTPNQDKSLLIDKGLRLKNASALVFNTFKDPLVAGFKEYCVGKGKTVGKANLGILAAILVGGTAKILYSTRVNKSKFVNASQSINNVKTGEVKNG